MQNLDKQLAFVMLLLSVALGGLSIGCSIRIYKAAGALIQATDAQKRIASALEKSNEIKRSCR